MKRHKQEHLHKAHPLMRFAGILSNDETHELSKVVEKEFGSVSPDIAIDSLDTATDIMKDEYDFSGMQGVRGKYCKAYRKGHTVKVHHDDGTVTVQYVTQEEGAVMLEPDVRKYFATSEAVNKALRMLISIFPEKKP